MIRRPPGTNRSDTLFPYASHFRASLAEADREAAGRRAVLPREVGGERIRILVEQEVHSALAIDRDRPALVAQHRGEAHAREVVARSEERRVGKECVSTCRARWSPYH